MLFLPTEQASGTQFSALNTHRYCILPKNVKHSDPSGTEPVNAAGDY
jgi:hypothetical protein